MFSNDFDTIGVAMTALALRIGPEASVVQAEADFDGPTTSNHDF